MALAIDPFLGPDSFLGPQRRGDWVDPPPSKGKDTNYENVNIRYKTYAIKYLTCCIGCSICEMSYLRCV